MIVKTSSAIIADDSTRPRTSGHALAVEPVGQAAEGEQQRRASCRGR